MTDQNSQFFAMLTAVGEAKQANADALGIAWKITHMGVGDANGTDPIPNRLQTTLLNERRRAPLNQLKVDPNNASILIAEQVIPEDVGGWWIREIGLYDEAGDLVAIANCAPSFKPQLSQGSGRTQVVRMNFIVSSAANVELKIDPSVVLATRKYVDDELAKLDHKQSVRYATTAAIALAGLAVQAGGDWAGALTAGDRVLVKNQANGKDNGPYAAAAGAWLRCADADGSPEVTSGLVMAVEQGATLADTRWQLVTDGAIVLGTTALVFQNVTQGFAPLASPIFIDNPRAPTPSQFDNDTSIATTEYVQRALGSYSGATDVANGSGADANAIGKNLNIGAGGSYLPSTVGIPNGAVLHYKNTGTGAHTLSRVGADLISCDGTTRTTIDVGQGEDLTLVRVNNIWIGSGNAALKYAASFGSSIGANGYKKIPDANSPTGFFILQWGVTAGSANATDYKNFPVAFPNACLQGFASYSSYALWGQGCGFAPISGQQFIATGYTSNGASSTASVRWLAIGY